MERILATYLIETPLAVEKAAETLAGEQSSGTFVAVPGETEELKQRSASGEGGEPNLQTRSHTQPNLACRNAFATSIPARRKTGVTRKSG